MNDKSKFYLEELVLLQYLFNMLLKFRQNEFSISAKLDHIEWIIFSAFMLSSLSDTIRLVIQSGGDHSNIITDGMLSIASISDMTGIPRQTVRRKCADLEERGVLVRERSRLYRCPIPVLIVEDISTQISALVKLSKRLTPQ